jgi:Tfp pilus assembly protein PilO
MPKSNNTLVLFATLAAVAAFAWFFVWPNVQLARERYAAWGQEKDDLVIIKETAVSINAAVSFAESLSSEERRLASLAAPSNPNQYDVATVLDNIARESGVTLQTLGTSPQKVVKEGELNQVGVTLAVAGSYSNVKNFLGRVETSLRIFDTTSLQLAASTPEGGDQIFLLSLSGQVYYAGEQQETNRSFLNTL